LAAGPNSCKDIYPFPRKWEKLKENDDTVLENGNVNRKKKVISLRTTK